ncbi:Alpha/Beta hydrolase protein [Melampsora americana]|nr:Alpha/Beta hydrolase protein [Melampsora americana]
MPYLELSHEVSLYYETYTSKTENPWILLLHPILTDISWTASFSAQAEIKEGFNCIVFDYRIHGRTQAPLTPTLDYYMFAADIAMGMQRLQLPPVHVIAVQFSASEVALRLAAVFPEKVLSMFLSGLCPDVYSEATTTAMNECFECLVKPVDTEHWEEVRIMAFQYLYFHKDENVSRNDEIDMIDEWTGLFLRRYSPSKATRLTAVGLLELGREKTPQAFRESIQQPILLVHGGESEVFPAVDAFERFETFTKRDPRSKYEEISGAPLVLVPLYTSRLTKMYLEWVQPIINGLGEQKPNVVDFKGNLERLSLLYDQPEIATRDASDSSNYYMIYDEMLQTRKDMLAYAEGLQRVAISLDGEDAPEWWTDASHEEKTCWKFSNRLAH